MKAVPVTGGPSETSEPEATAERKSEAGAGAAAAADPGAKPAAEPEAGAGAEAGAERGTNAEGEAGTETSAETEAETGTGTNAGAGAEAGADTRADGDAGTETEAGTEARAEGEGEAGSATRTEGESEIRTNASTGTKAGTGAIAETGDGTEKAEAGTGAEAEADAGTVPEAEAGAEPEAEAGTEPEPEPETEAGTEPEAGAEPEPEAEAGAEPEAEAGAKPEAETGAKPEAETGAKPEAEAGAGAGAGGGPGVEVRAGGGAAADVGRARRFVALKPLDSPVPTAPAEPQRREPVVVEPTREAPLPPLDLLAELTNTAPPPETPRRTLTRRVKVWTPVLLLLAAAFTGVQLARPLPAPEIVSAESVHTLDGALKLPWPAHGQGAIRIPGSGDIGTFGEQKPVPTASVAKVMTAYVILKDHPLGKAEAGPQIAIDAKAVADGTSENESRVKGLVEGTKYSQQDMLKMLMIPSGNNIARLLARWDAGSGSEAAFVAKMNAAAAALGMQDTTYTDPSGLDAGTVSTAVDQLKLAEVVMKFDAFRAVVSLQSATIPGLPEQLVNNNSLLAERGLSVMGIKTGSSTPAGGALMWASYKSVGEETPLILGALMEQRAEGSDPNALRSLALVLANSKKVIESVRQGLTSAPVIRQGQVVGYVDDKFGGRAPLVAAKDLNVAGVPGQQLRVSLKAGAATVPHSAKAGAEIGVLTVGDGEGAKSVPVLARDGLPEPSFGARLTRLR
ncbi:serine hydrolase [Streptomyces sp. NPDC060028]|uniref:D-alanyl-D-alanine carboxypeptidase family protein n=1 Tax=Streptomyces sp. NPDC060028 TaxID=3347041 RepID=UPI0036A7F0F4